MATITEWYRACPYVQRAVGLALTVMVWSLSVVLLWAALTG